MPNTTTSPNMNLPVPVVSVDPGPDWANDINACLAIIDSHDHASGQGVQITPDGININADLPFASNNAITLRSTRFTPQSAPIALSTDVGCLYESGVDLYYNDGNGNQVRITQGGSVTGSTGTISGLPSGTASASYSAGTFTFESATNTPAIMAVGPLIIGRQSALSKTVTLTPAAAQPSNYTLTFPAAAPTIGQALVSDGSGNFSWMGSFQAAGTFLATLSDCVGTPSENWYYSVANNVVVISPGDSTFTFTKNGGSGTIGISGFPSTILPTSSTLYAAMYLSVNSGNSYVPATLQIGSGGVILYRDIAQNDIIANSACVFSPVCFTYQLRS